jgi:acyl-CoA thioesterase I
MNSAHMRAPVKQFHMLRVARALGQASGWRVLVACLCMLGVALSCGTREESDPALESAASRAAPRTATSAAPRIVCLGDSLTAGLGVSPEEAYPAVLQRRLREAGYPHEVVNAGVSGDTSAGGLRRLDWSMDANTRVVIVALGANDGLRGLPVAELRRNLTAIVTRAKARQADVLLAGMEAPPNFGQTYVRDFRRTYVEVARALDVPFLPFLLEGVAGVAALNQRDGVHPTAEGQQRIADLLWSELEPLLGRATGSR